MTGIYIIRNKINNKKYVGQSINIKKRFSEHRVDGTSGLSTGNLHRAIYKYGVENFDFEVLEECLVEELDEKEIFWIEKKNSLSPNGYNIQFGGASGRTITQEYVFQVKDLILNSELSFIEIGEKMGLRRETISRINNGKTWRNEEEEYPLREEKRLTDEKLYCECGQEKSPKANFCLDCYNIKQRRVERPTKGVLIKEIALKGFSWTGRKYGVSDNAIKKWCVAYGLPKYKKEIVKIYQSTKER